MSQSDEEIVLLPLTLGKGGMMTPLRMPDVMSILIHDFIRPDWIKIAADEDHHTAMAELNGIVEDIEEMVEEMDFDVDAEGGMGASILHRYA